MVFSPHCILIFIILGKYKICSIKSIKITISTFNIYIYIIHLYVKMYKTTIKNISEYNKSFLVLLLRVDFLKSTAKRISTDRDQNRHWIPSRYSWSLDDTFRLCLVIRRPVLLCLAIRSRSGFTVGLMQLCTDDSVHCVTKVGLIITSSQKTPPSLWVLIDLYNERNEQQTEGNIKRANRNNVLFLSCYNNEKLINI